MTIMLLVRKKMHQKTYNLDSKLWTLLENCYFQRTNQQMRKY